jgi:uncharacterized membrane protein
LASKDKSDLPLTISLLIVCSNTAMVYLLRASFYFRPLSLVSVLGHLWSFLLLLIKLQALSVVRNCVTFLFGMSDMKADTEADKETDKLMDSLKGLVIGASGNIPGYQHR